MNPTCCFESGPTKNFVGNVAPATSPIIGSGGIRNKYVLDSVLSSGRLKSAEIPESLRREAENQTATRRADLGLSDWSSAVTNLHKCGRR